MTRELENLLLARAVFVGVLAVLFAVVWPTSPALARCTAAVDSVEEEHPIVIPFPTETIADKIIQADAVVLAREAADKPFSYEAHTVLRGTIDESEDIDLFMNSFNRRLLTKFPDRNMVLVRTVDEEEVKWEAIGKPHPEIEELVNEILENSESWDMDSTARIDFFAQRLGHQNTTIHNLAYLEVGQAPYSEIRKLVGVVPSAEIHPFIRQVQYADWHALYILLLGLSDDAFDQNVIKSAFDRAARYRSDSRLAAWATAYMEFDPEGGLEAITREYFSTPGRDLKELDAVTTAISAHGSEGQVHLRDEIVESYKIMLENYPDAVAPVVRDLMDWERWDLVDTLRDIMKNPPEDFNYMSSILARRYIQAAAKAADE